MNSKNEKTDLAERGKSGRFKAGTSGNPAGRPPSQYSQIRQQLTEAKDGIIQAVIQAALDGDMSAARIVMDRLIPPLKPIAQSVQFEITADSSPLELAREILKSTASGQIPPDLSSQLITSLANLCRIEEVEELRLRISALEKATLSQTKPLKP